MRNTKAKLSSAESARERANRDVAYRAAVEGIVLLENDGTLPINETRVALFGAGATHTTKGGTGSGEVNERRSINIMEGIQAAQIAVTTPSWIADYERVFNEAREVFRKQTAKKLRIPTFNAMGEAFTTPFVYPPGPEISDADIAESGCDTCIYVISRQAGEGMDRKLDNGDNNITDSERANLIKCANAYKKFIVVINVGASFDVSFVDEIPGINALIFFAQQGSEGGHALADILTGKTSPSGKLTDTWAKSYKDIPFANEYSYLNGDLDNEQYKEGIYVGYRYFDRFDVEPRYPFGYGLSYTKFKIDFSELNVESDKAVLGVSVTNIGDQIGKEVVQVFVACPQSELDKPLQQLAGFAKTRALNPGETQSLQIEVNLTYLASYVEADASFVLEAGDYLIQVGASSRDAVAAAILELPRTVIISTHDNICPQQVAFEDLKPSGHPKLERHDALPRYTVDPAKIVKTDYSYGSEATAGSDEAEALLSTLSREDLVELVVGAGMKGMLFGEGYFVAPGAVGQTTSNLTHKGLMNAPMADGPAGLRLQKRTVFTRKGTAKMVDPSVEALEFLPGIFKRFVFANPKRKDLYYQYATAFPVALSLGQTWNETLIEEVGHAIGKEMLEYGIMFWLGPGMNLHRNPLCGRNFEYYSEDPLLSGKLAAAAVRGCQSHGGIYATIKHFAVNNQESNRFAVSSNLSERALREIYLRGFEIAVREGDPKAVMTAYNKVNGVYASNSHDLNTKVLRNEWGFNGVVMTDWMATRKGWASNPEAMVAGNDLIMPGGKEYRKSLLEALNAGTIKDEDVRKCARNIVRVILESALAKEFSLEPA